jgi:Uncharacterized flavoproteins
MLKIIGKILGVILIVFVALIIIGIVTVVIITKSNDAYKGDFKTELKGKDATAEKALVIYQPSKSKASKEVAYKLAEGLNSQGYDVTITYPGKHIESDMSSYSIISFGSPVFFGKPSAAVTKTIERLKDIKGKTVILYSVGGSNEAMELDSMKKLFSDVTPKYVMKFLVSDEEKEKKAYDLGIKAGKESRGIQ